MLLRNAFALLNRLLPTEEAFAHCDIPCGIYDPTPAKIAADTVAKMVEKINQLPANATDATTRGNFVRMIAVKEEHAQICKKELEILWSDYFKPEHLEKVPNLHELFWNATKQVSKVKASTDAADSQKLLDLIDEVDAAWKATGGNDKTRVAGRPA